MMGIPAGGRWDSEKAECLGEHSAIRQRVTCV